MVSNYDLCSDDWDTIGGLIQNNPNMMDNMSICELQENANQRIFKDRKRKNLMYDDELYNDERVVEDHEYGD